MKLFGILLLTITSLSVANCQDAIDTEESDPSLIRVPRSAYYQDSDVYVIFTFVAVICVFMCCCYACVRCKEVRLLSIFFQICFVFVSLLN